MVAYQTESYVFQPHFKSSESTIEELPTIEIHKFSVLLCGKNRLVGIQLPSIMVVQFECVEISESLISHRVVINRNSNMKLSENIKNLVLLIV